MGFNPDHCRNESEVESKLIVQYLLPQLGYTPDTWHQEVTFGKIRLDFLAFASQNIPFILDANSPLSVVMEAKHPSENLDKHIRRLTTYLISLNVRHGLLTNGKEIRIFRIREKTANLVFHCSGREVESKIDEIRYLIGKDSLNLNQSKIASSIQKTLPDLFDIPPSPQIIPETQRQHTVKTIAVYHNKGGVGKTTTVVNLAAAIRKQGKKVLVIDLDSQANTTFAAGLAKFEDEELDDIKDCNIRHVLQSEDFYSITEVAKKSQFNDPEIDVVPAHISLMEYEFELNSLDYSKLILIQKLKEVENNYDVVIIDTPPSLNLYARIGLITADYLIIPSDLKPFANQGLLNVKNFVKQINGFKKMTNKAPLQVLGVLPCKISTNSRFVQYTLPKRLEIIPRRYEFKVMDTVIYEREELAKCIEQVQIVGNLDIPDPRSVFDFRPDSSSAQEFELLAREVLQAIGIKK
ncbi:Cobyrinic acid ac-diamide synthase [Crinalium epipsammum PCC 9333]|uniref:Cobyrinic acid ac-diamide synthase n=1 Tax=Crinalium epipsammum PCC 9333 TaxID=1173022 RepID=K9VZZ6_9CYAN|nr:AAA family ATPase [Crinalium epipsammum]AFZ13057.1 Cobyrinic acid ac-diamide synthase [Crinalium epipsammum PCC 9333]